MRAPLAVTALLLIVACSSNESFTRTTDSQTEPGQAYVAAAVSSAYRQYGAGLEDRTRCFMAGLVDIFGLDALQEAGPPAELLVTDPDGRLWVGPEDSSPFGPKLFAGLDVSESQAREGADSYFACFDVAEVYMIPFLTEEERDCVRSAVDNSDSELRAVVKGELLGHEDTSFANEMEELLMDQCHVTTVLVS